MRRKKTHEAKFRDFYFLDRDQVPHNYMKYMRDVIHHCRRRRLLFNHVQILLYVYDLEFFTIKYLCDYTGWSNKSVRNVIGELSKQDLLYRHFDRSHRPQDRLEYMFRDETKRGYRTRYALTTKGRNIVKDVYLIANQGHK